MRFDDGPANRKTDAHAVRLAGHEGLKQVLRDLRGYSRSRIGHRKIREAVLMRDADRQLPPLGGFHRFDGIPDQIEGDLLNLNLVDHNFWKIAIAAKRDAY